TPRSLYLRLPSLPRRSRRVAVIAAFAGYPLLQIGYAQLRATDLISATVWAPIAIGLFLATLDRKSTRLNSSHDQISYAVFCLKKKKNRCQSGAAHIIKIVQMSL